MAALEQEDQDYDSASDEDFNPEIQLTANVQSDDQSSDDDAAGGTKKRKNEDGLDWDNSGDEITIRRAKRKKPQREKGANETVDDDEGEGGLIKTRAQRQAEVHEKKPLHQVESSIDVDSLWAQMSTVSKRSNANANADATVTSEQSQSKDATPLPETKTSIIPSAISASTNGPETLIIRRTYEYAGETMTEERSVSATSAEGRLYLNLQVEEIDESKITPLRRLKKRTLLSSNSSDGAQGKRLNTLEKSRLDWAGFVDQEGIAEELEGHDKAKDEYLGRMDFLGRLGAKKDDELRNLKQR